MVFCNRILRIPIHHHEQSHNPYFNRWFSAIGYTDLQLDTEISHNPYFNRWFSAIKLHNNYHRIKSKSQSLF